MRDVIEVSYTGDLLAHRRCGRAWAYEKHAGFHPYEQVQAMEGRLIHHAMEWLTRQHIDEHGRSRHATEAELQKQLEHHFRVLWSRGVRTAFASKADTLARVVGHLFPSGAMHPTVKAVIEGARHTEYELRSVRKLIGATAGSKQKLLLTGILDLVVQQQSPLAYETSWTWSSRERLEGAASKARIVAQTGDVEIWDYKGTRANTTLVGDYVRQLLTYAYLYRERTGQLPARCVLYFVNEPAKTRDRQLLAIEVDEDLIQRAVDWTHTAVAELQSTLNQYQSDPQAVVGGDRTLLKRPVGQRITADLRAQCTACGLRFDCPEYKGHLGGPKHPDIDILNVHKN